MGPGARMPPVFNQGQLGSCSANALVAAMAFDDPSMIGSRLFLCPGRPSVGWSCGCRSAFAFVLVWMQCTDGWMGSVVVVAPRRHYNERTLENSVADDSGAALSDGVTALHAQGRPPFARQLDLPHLLFLTKIQPLHPSLKNITNNSSPFNHFGHGPKLSGVPKPKSGSVPRR